MAVTNYEPHKSSVGGLDANVLAMLTYIAGIIICFIPGIRYFAFLVPLVIYLMEKESVFVKFHAFQAFILNATCAILSFLVSVVVGGIVSASITSYNYYTISSSLGVLGVLGFIVTIISIVIAVFAIIAMVKAYQYTEYRIPIAGKFAAKIAHKNETL